MSSFSASYNFPPDFKWGSAVSGQFLLEKDNFSYLYQLKDNGINDIVITLNWADYEPLKNNYNETLIDSTRNLLSRIHNFNIDPMLILDIGEIPQWQNLEKTNIQEVISTSKYNFSIHLIESLIPYTNLVGIKTSVSSFFSGKQFTNELTVFQDIRKYIQSVSPQAKTGLIIPSEVFQVKVRNIIFLPKKVNFSPLQKAEADFLGINPDPDLLAALKNSFPDKNFDLIVHTDKMKISAPDLKYDEIINNIYNIWRFYQEGWKITGYFSDINLNTETPEKTIFTNICNKNSLVLSTDDAFLPEKWIRFLKD